MKKRLIGRNSETAEEIENRLNRLDYELSLKDKYDYIVVNDSVDGAVEEIISIIDNAKNKA